ncbi:carbon-nitrogen hydrolase family protein [Mesobacillus foraminis]|uniref:N-carbamoylputrescine amidase n=1 Tax=Mesobacillus foraminis TaxID=279826 RepID=A0A4R2B4P3_9BACI|nr:carbon-nitrogen hydrolase family protein [Mesobacillus foraminis]TCN21145.1 N-carbamoylputrescine amidase [Mesobacillus foraminis]
MKLKVVGLQSGPNIEEKGYHGRIEQLAAQFDKALLEVPDADLIVFPELMTLPYFCKVRDETFFDLAEPLKGETFQFFSEKAKAAGVFAIITIFEKDLEGGKTLYYNTAIVISDEGEMVGYYRKTHIPKLSLATLTTDETLYFSRGLGYPVFEIKGIKVGILICFDRSFPEASRALALQGADLIVIPTAAGGEERKNAWLSECQARARENGLYVMGVNKAGEETINHLGSDIKSQFFGLSCAFGPDGKEVAHNLDSTPWKALHLEVDTVKIAETRRKLSFLDFLQGIYIMPIPMNFK